MRRILEVYPKTEKCCFLDLAPPTLQNSGMFHDSTRPHLHSDGSSGCWQPPRTWLSSTTTGTNVRLSALTANHGGHFTDQSTRLAQRRLKTPRTLSPSVLSLYHTTIDRRLSTTTSDSIMTCTGPTYILTCLFDYILEAAPTVTICDGALETVLRVMAP